MNKVKHTCIVFALASLFLLLNSCHKYSEDPFISLRKPANRLYGTWEFTSYQIYGVEHSRDFDSYLTPNTLTDLTIWFSNEASDPYIFHINNGNNPVVAGNSTISNDNKTIYFQAGAQADSVFFNFFVKAFKITKVNSTQWNFPNWTIVELYGKNFHISNNCVDIYFKKQ